jgi:hypothetical protein
MEMCALEAGTRRSKNLIAGRRWQLRHQPQATQMSNAIITSTNFSTSKVTVTNPRVLDSGAKQSYVNYDSGKFILQTPQNITLPYGLGQNDKTKFGGVGIDYSIDLSMKGYDDPTSPVHGYYKMLTDLDEHIIALAHKNSKAWFGKERSVDSIRDNYKSSVKFAMDKEGNPKPYPPTHKLKLRKLNGEFETKFYNPKGKPYRDMPAEELLPKNAQVTVLAKVAGLWFSAAGFGLTWRAEQIVIHKLPERMKDFAFVGIQAAAVEDDEEETVATGGAGSGSSAQIDDDDVFTAVKPSAISAVMPAPVHAPVAVAAEPESDAEHEAEDHEPIPAPAPVKKVVTKIVKKVVKA